MTLYWHFNSQRFTQSAGHIPDFREPSIDYEIIGCWNCAGDGDVDASDGFGGLVRSECGICGGTGDLATSVEQYEQEDYFEELRELGLLTILSSEWNLP